MIYFHGFASSAATGTVATLCGLLPEVDVTAPDIPVDPAEALPFLKELCRSERPDIVVGTSMGAMYAQQMRGFKRICVNPAFEMSKTSEVLKVGVLDFHYPRMDGQTRFTIPEEVIRHFAEMEERQFDGITGEERELVWGMFGDADTVVNCKGLFMRHYHHVVDFAGEHRLNEAVVRDVLAPLIRRMLAMKI